MPTAKHTQLKRNWKTKRHTCVFCNKSVSKLPVHFKRHHKETIEISRYLSLEKNSDDSVEKMRTKVMERSRILSSLRKSGNFNHNVAVREREDTAFLKLSGGPAKTQITRSFCHVNIALDFITNMIFHVM